MSLESNKKIGGNMATCHEGNIPSILYRNWCSELMEHIGAVAMPQIYSGGNNSISIVQFSMLSKQKFNELILLIY